MPAKRAQWLRAVADVVDEVRDENSPARKAEQDAMLADAKRKAGQL